MQPPHVHIRTAAALNFNVWGKSGVPFARSILTLSLALALTIILPNPAAAQLGSKSAQEWLKTLDSPNRVARLRIDEIISRLRIRPGEVIADIGAGSGLYSLPLARAASPGGKVYAVDIEPGLLDHIAGQAREAQVTNVQTVLGEFSDPDLPATNVDLAFINDVLHHIEHREEYLQNLSRYLKPSARVVIIDFHPELSPHKHDPALQVSKKQAAAWMAACGFTPAEEFDLFKDKYFVVYARRAQPKARERTHSWWARQGSRVSLHCSPPRPRFDS